MKTSILLLVSFLLAACVVEEVEADSDVKDPPGLTTERASTPIDQIRLGPIHALPVRQECTNGCMWAIPQYCPQTGCIRLVDPACWQEGCTCECALPTDVGACCQ